MRTIIKDAGLMSHITSMMARSLSSFTAESSYHSFIDDKVSSIRGRTANARPAEYRVHTGSLFASFSAPTEDEVIACVMSSPSKHCHVDPLPTWLFEAAIGTLAPFLTSFMIASLKGADFPRPWKHAITRPHLKSPGLDLTDASN